MHSSPYGPAGGGLRGTFPNPQVVTDDASLVIAHQVFLRHGAAPSASTSAGGLTNWTEAVNTAAPNVTIPVVSFAPNNAATHVDAVIVPKGNQAGFMLAIPDNLATGGNKRGVRAVDLSLGRTANTSVASGLRAFQGGGFDLTASGTDSVAHGNSSTASGPNSVAIGLTSTASAQSSYAIGDNILCNAAYTTGFGQFGSSWGMIGCLTHAIGGATVNPGARQGRHILLARTSNGTTPIVLTSDEAAPGLTNQLTVPNNGTVSFSGKLTIKHTTNRDGGMIPITGAVVARSFGTTALCGTPVLATYIGIAGYSGVVLSITADNTNNSMQFTFTGLTGVGFIATIEGWAADVL